MQGLCSSITINNWISNLFRPWFRLHVDYVRPLNGAYDQILVDSFSKWRKIYKWRRPTSNLTFPHKIFWKLRIPETTVSDNGAQFSSSDFRDFYKYYAVERIKNAAITSKTKWPAWTFYWYIKEMKGDWRSNTLRIFMNL